MKAMVTRRSNPVTRNPDKRSSRCVPFSGNVESLLQKSTMRPKLAVRALLTRMHRDVLMQAVDVPLGQRCEDHPHKVTVSCAMRGAP